MKPGRKRWIITAATALAIIGAGVLAFIYLPEPLQRWQANRLLNAFRANPCQQTADPLIDLLEKSKVKEDQGNEILAAMLEPKAVLKASYAPGEMIIVDVVPKHDVKVEGLTGNWGCAFNILLPGWNRTNAEFSTESESVRLARSLDSFGGRSSYVGKGLTIPNVGDYPCEVQLIYSLGAPTNLGEALYYVFSTYNASPWQRFKNFVGFGAKEPKPAIQYNCSFRLPVAIRVAATSPASSPATAGAATKP